MELIKEYLDKISNIIYKWLNKVSVLISDKKNSKIIKSFIKIILIVIFYLICGVLVNVLDVLGTNLIYYFGTTARSALSLVWQIFINFGYFLFVVVTLYKFIIMMEKDDSFMVFFRNKRKNDELKSNVLDVLGTIIKILGVVVLIPLFIFDIGLLYALGVMIGYLNQGVYLISLFVIVLSLIFFFTTLIFFIKRLLSIYITNFRKYATLIIISGLFVSLGSCLVLLEVSNYETNNSLTTDFTEASITNEYKINTNKEYIITNNGSDKNITFTTNEDLGSYIEIVITHYTTNKIESDIREYDDVVMISYDEEFDLSLNDLEDILSLGVTCVKEKTLYNYTLLKYATIEVRVSSDYQQYIKTVDSKGKEYLPYE